MEVLRSELLQRDRDGTGRPDSRTLLSRPRNSMLVVGLIMTAIGLRPEPKSSIEAEA
jgi:hypothetical protein